MIEDDSIVYHPNVVVEFTRQIFSSKVHQSMTNRGEYKVFKEGVYGIIKGLYNSYEVDMGLRVA